MLKRSGNSGIFFYPITVLLILCAVFAVFLEKKGDYQNDSSVIGDENNGPQTAIPSFAFGGSKSSTFAVGTTVEGVEIGGTTHDEALKKLEPIVNMLKENYRCRLMYENGELCFTEKDMNLASDLNEKLELALNAGSGEYFLELRPIDDRKLRSSIDAAAEKLDTSPRDAELLSADSAAGSGLMELERNSRFVVTAPLDGKKVDRRETLDLILSGALEGKLPFTIAEASKDIPSLPMRRAVFTTSYNSPGLSAPGRVFNVKKASGLLYGRALAPGKKLSCNEVLGERTKENGWQTATAFASGGKQTELQYGGGICQVSTTLYNCALMAGLDVVERIGHSRKVAYVEGGRDASLSWGSADLVIQNSTDETVYIFMWTDDDKNCLSCEIYGGAFPEEYDKIELSSELIEVIEPSEPEFIEDSSLLEGECVQKREAIRGRIYQTYAEYRKNGVTVRREKVANTPYQMIPALYAVPKKMKCSCGCSKALICFSTPNSARPILRRIPYHRYAHRTDRIYGF